MRHLPILLFLLCSFIPNENLQATHALGGDLIYEQIGPNEYFITLRIYRDCNGIALNTTEDIEWMGSCGSGSILATRISDLDITPLCPGSPTACNGGTGSIGIEEHVYTATVTLPNNCTDVNFNYTLCCRNHIITTLIDPGNENIFLYATHQNTSIPNHSPIFNNYPSPIVCVNQPVLYNHGVSDPDGDSLYFSAGNCYEALNDTVEYLAGYNGVTPLTTVNPIILNPNTGSISFTPNIQQVGVMCILVEEFRNGVKIGETIRDIQFNVIACANVPPIASGINNLPGADSLDFVFNICESNVVCFDLSFSDPDVDVLNVTWNGEIVGATFQVSANNTIAPTAQFCWSPQPSDVGLNYFSVNITDDACPLVGSSTYTYTVDVLPNPNTMTLSYANLICNSDSQEISLFPSSTIDSLYWTPNPSLSALPNGNGLAYPTSAQTYIVRAYFPDGCYVEEQAPMAIAAPPSIQANANTSNICNGGTVVLNGLGGVSYTWSGGVLNNVPFAPSPGYHTYVVTGEDANGCTNEDSVTIQVNPIVTIVATPDTNICDGETVSLSGQGALSYSWNNGIQNAVPFTPNLGTTNYVMTATDVNGCIAQDSIAITANPLPNVQAMASSIIICQGDSLSLTSSGVINPVWSNGVTEGVRFIPVVGTQSYAVSGSNSFGCLGADSIVVQVNPLPNINITASGDSICEGNTISLIASGASTYNWSNGVNQNIPFIPNAGFNMYTVSAIDTNACAAEDSVGIMVNPLPIISAVASDSIICDGEYISLTASGAQTYVWSNGISNGVSFTPSLGVQTYTVVGTDANNCQNQTNLYVTINPNPNIAIQTSNNGNELCEGETVILTASGAPSLTWNNGVINNQPFSPPLGSTTYIVNAENMYACTTIDSVEIMVNPLPTVNAVASANDVCYGDSVMLQCPGNVMHNWTNGVVGGVNFLPPLGTTRYTLNIVDSNLCENSDSVDVRVFALPTITALANDSSVCEGQTVALFAIGAQNYTWSNGLNNGTPFTPPLGQSIYTVSGVDTNGCSNTANIQIVSHPNPSVSPLGGDTSICFGETIILSGAGADSYVWNNGVEDGQGFVPNTGIHDYIVVGTDLNGCSSSDSVQVEVFELPEVVALSSDDSICLGESIQLNGSGAISYTWTNGINDGDFISPSLGATTFTVIGVDANLCENMAEVTVHAIPLATLEPLEDVEFCDVNELEISSEGEYVGSYQWGGITAIGGFNLIEGTDYLGTQSADLGIYNLLSAGSHTFYVNVVGICGNEVSDTFNIVSHQSPTVDLLGDTSLCSHEENAIITNAEGFNFIWNDGTPGQILSPSYSGMYYVEFEEYNTGCIISDTLFIEMEDCIDQCVVLAPTGFSPNNDGANDGFKVVSTCGEGFSYFNLMIYNRWGEKVFQTDDPYVAWDGIYKGKPAELSTYAYAVEYTKEYSQEKEMLKGNVTLVK